MRFINPLEIFTIQNKLLKFEKNKELEFRTHNEPRIFSNNDLVYGLQIHTHIFMTVSSEARYKISYNVTETEIIMLGSICFSMLWNYIQNYVLWEQVYCIQFWTPG